MSEKTEKISVEFTEALNVLVQYGCLTCGDIFASEELYNEHLGNCLSTVLSAKDPLEGARTDRASKRKLDNSTGEISSSNIFEDPAEGNSSLNTYACKKIKKCSTDVKQEQDNVTLENTAYGATTQLISDNEMLITLPYDQVNECSEGPLDFSNEVSIGFDQHTQDLNNFHQQFSDRDDIFIENYNVDDFGNVDHHDTVKILSVFTKKPPQKCDTGNSEESQRDSAVGMIEHTDNESDTILTVLKPVNISKIREEGEEITVVNILGHTTQVEKERGFDIDKEVLNDLDTKERTLGKRAKATERPVDQTIEEVSQDTHEHNEPNKTKNINLSSQTMQVKASSMYQKLSKTNLIDSTIEKLTEKLKTSQILKSRGKQKLNKDILATRVSNKKRSEKNRRAWMQNMRQESIVNNMKNSQEDQSAQNSQDLNSVENRRQFSYSRINAIKHEKNEPEQKPNKFAIYEFFDEEEERIRALWKKEVEREKEMNRRTCKICKELFNDPIDALRHKRQFHRVSKIVMTRQELDPHFKAEKKTECPICFRQLSPKGHESIFQKHLFTHCDEYNFRCRVCGMQFRRKDHWDNHERRHVVRPEDMDNN